MRSEQRGDGVEAGFRVEELSARTETPVRTIREYQTWQILHPPTRVGRVGLYDGTHVARLQGITRLQERGYSIAAIRDLFDAWEQGAGLREVLGVDDAIGFPADEAAITLTTEQLGEVLGPIARSERLLARACNVGLLHREDGGFVARSPALVQLVADVLTAGLSPTRALDLADAVVSAAQRTGAAAAAIVATGSEAGVAAVDPLVRRGRVLLARAVATHTIDQVGRHLTVLTEQDPELGELLASVRIGFVAGGGRTAVEPTGRGRR